MITLYSGLVVKNPLVEHVIPAFERETGTHIEATFEPTTVLLERIAAGERPDLVLGVSSSVTDLAAQGLVDPEVVAEIAVSSVGFARPDDAAGPADDSATTFLDYLLAARAVAYTLSGASGVHFMKMLRERGLLERIDERAVRCESGLTAEALLDGRADVAIQQVSELRSVPGAHVVEPIPHELQSYGRFAVGARPGAGDDASRFVTLLTEKPAQDAFAAFGLSRP
ncbi:substrate-binding domain-containing protein [Microbacterium sp. ZOR0019]|uniref:substrate-binding domain-containing protein n=1 Tax=Microbacterium sp. ZOR0019 TaxID=1339233 RepID=UPI00068A54BC|nr:substrate-binding domain-containing protein [Microbacterium sp. ZOR0019]